MGGPARGEEGSGVPVGGGVRGGAACLTVRACVCMLEREREREAGVSRRAGGRAPVCKISTSGIALIQLTAELERDVELCLSRVEFTPQAPV